MPPGNHVYRKPSGRRNMSFRIHIGTASQQICQPLIDDGNPKFFHLRAHSRSQWSKGRRLAIDFPRFYHVSTSRLHPSRQHRALTQRHRKQSRVFDPKKEIGHDPKPPFGQSGVGPSLLAPLREPTRHLPIAIERPHTSLNKPLSPSCRYPTPYPNSDRDSTLHRRTSNCSARADWPSAPKKYLSNASFYQHLRTNTCG